MRILYLIKSFDFGGAENHVMELANTMSVLGNDVVVASRKGRQSALLDGRIKFIPLRLNDIFLPLQIIYLCFIIYRNRIDVIHAHKRLAIVAASFSGRIMDKSVVATIHGRPRYDMRSRLSRRLTDKVIFVNNTTYKANYASRDFRNKSVLIHNGVKISGIEVSKNHNSILYISRIDRKHFEVISMLMNNVIPLVIEKYPDVTLEVAGDGEFLNTLKNKAEIMNRRFGREVYIFHGLLNDVRTMVCHSGVVLGVGRVALEALACAVPVISLNRKFMGEMITGDNYEFYRLNNFVAIGRPEPDALIISGLINNYLHDPPYWHSEAKALSMEVAGNLSIEKICSDILELYREIEG